MTEYHACPTCERRCPYCASAALNRETPEDRFMKRVRVDEQGCWRWQGKSTPAGYGLFKLDGGYRSAHRCAYEMFRGDIPDGLFICHRCDIPNCVNPDHLFTGTSDDNLFDARQKGRFTHSAAAKRRVAEYAERCRKLTMEQADEARALVASGMSQAEAGRRLGVQQNVISQIIRGITYKHQ